MEASPSEMSENIPENSNLNNRRRDNLKSHLESLILFLAPFLGNIW
jgi:hypothetical protein